MSRRPRDPSFEALAARLNQGVRRRNARLHFRRTYPFGSDLTLRAYALGNGLELLLLPDPSAPVVSLHTWFRVGSRDERPGKTGLAHLLEHLMFGGTRAHPPGEFDRLLEAAGAETNAATWTDWTFYYESLPASALGLALTLESDRMRRLVLRAGPVASEKEVVQNERRLAVEDDLGGLAAERLFSMAFRGHPYGRPTIGWMQDIEGLEGEDCRAFYRRYYAPNNATLVVVGKFDEGKLLAMIQEAYGGMAAASIPERRESAEPIQRAERRLTLHRPTPSPKVQLGYRAPAFGDPDWIALSVLVEILFGGRSSRMHRRLVRELELCAELHGSLTPFAEPGLFEVWLAAREGVEDRVMLEAFDAEIEALRAAPLPESELERARNQLELAFLRGLETAAGKAEQIGFHATVLRDPGAIFERLEATQRVDLEELHRVCRRYLRKSQRSIVRILPSAPTGAA
ncbi:MAG: insulinase family protein [Myxococcales bacterium]|nr:insulinase family protein [Myxococcales bacterium]